MDNNHKPFTKDQQKELTELIGMVDKFFNKALGAVKEENFEKIDQLVEEREAIFDYLGKIEKNQIKRIKSKEVNTRNSQLFFKINSEIRNLLLHTVNVIKSERDFITFTRQKK